MTLPFATPTLPVAGAVVAEKYVLKRLLGAGGMGVVYEAEHQITRRRVALKLLRPDPSAGAEGAARFLREAQASSSIGHPNIVEVLDAGTDAAHGMYLVLEYLDGEELAVAVERGGVGTGALIDLVLQVLDALGAAHAQGFVHRDIKPENVFLVRDRDGAQRAKLLDFGIARGGGGEQRVTATGAVLGTPWFMSPEQARGEAVDARSDLWSVGAMLFQALTGSAPFDGNNVNVVMVAVITTRAPSLRSRLPRASAALCEVVDRALQREPDGRWESAAAMAAALRAVPERTSRAALPDRRDTRDGSSRPTADSAEAMLSETLRASLVPSRSTGHVVAATLVAMAVVSVVTFAVVRDRRHAEVAHAPPRTAIPLPPPVTPHAATVEPATATAPAMPAVALPAEVPVATAPSMHAAAHPLLHPRATPVVAHDAAVHHTPPAAHVPFGSEAF